MGVDGFRVDTVRHIPRLALNLMYNDQLYAAAKASGNNNFLKDVYKRQTENPYFYVYNAILSRSTVFEFKPVPPEEIERAADNIWTKFLQRVLDFIQIVENVRSVSFQINCDSTMKIARIFSCPHI